MVDINLLPWRDYVRENKRTDKILFGISSFLFLLFLLYSEVLLIISSLFSLFEASAKSKMPVPYRIPFDKLWADLHKTGPLLPVGLIQKAVTEELRERMSPMRNGHIGPHGICVPIGSKFTAHQLLAREPVPVDYDPVQFLIDQKKYFEVLRPVHQKYRLKLEAGGAVELTLADHRHPFPFLPREAHLRYLECGCQICML